MSYIKDPSIRHIPKFGGELWFVSAGMSASGNGQTPDKAFKTIGEAITACAAGDSITVMAGTYTEVGIDLDKNNVEMWFEIGAIIDPATGNCLTISGNYCWVGCQKGALKINNNSTASTGVVVTGMFCYLSEIRVACASTGTIGFHIGDASDSTKGNGADLRGCRCSSPLTAGFKVQADKVKLENCCTGGDAGDSSIGFWVTTDGGGNCDKTRLKECGSQGHETAGFQIDTGCTGGVVESCYSGGGDGKWADADNAFVWSHFAYPETKYGTSTFTTNGGVGGTGTKYNIFKVIGSIEVFNIYGHVITVIPNTASNINLELYSSNNAVDITDTSAPTPDLDSLPVGATMVRASLSDDPLLIGNPGALPAIIEEPNFRNVSVPITLVKDVGADTYIQVNLSAALASGAIHWHVEWKPVTDDGFLEEI